jgi:hypothetical protein
MERLAILTTATATTTNTTTTTTTTTTTLTKLHVLGSHFVTLKYAHVTGSSDFHSDVRK